LPARALAEAMMVGMAGVLLLSPGYFTDLMGLVLLIPPVRGAIYGWLKSRVSVSAAMPGGFGPAPRRPAPDDVVDLDADEWRPR
jgi:UPF0716 protein FxsA